MSPNEVLSKLQMDYELYIFFQSLKILFIRNLYILVDILELEKNVQVLIW